MIQSLCDRSPRGAPAARSPKRVAPARAWLIGLSLALGTASAGDLLPLSADQRQALGIQTGELGRQAGAVATGLPARVTVPPTQVAVLAAPVTGVIHRVDKAHSDSVQAGEPIATLTSAQLVEDQLSLFRAASQHRLAAENAARDAHLLKEGIIAGASMVLVDVHPFPEKALCDGPQALRLEQVPRFVEYVRRVRACYDEVRRSPLE